MYIKLHEMIYRKILQESRTILGIFHKPSIIAHTFLKEDIFGLMTSLEILDHTLNQR